MENNISLTLRLPQDLNAKLQKAGKSLGLTKANFLRFAIWSILDVEPQTIILKDYDNQDKFRLAFNINQLTYNLLETNSKKYDCSINALVVAVATIFLERYSKYL